MKKEQQFKAGADMKSDRSIIKSLLMISQIGISMMVPVFLCVFIGLKLDKWLKTNFLTIILLILGILAAVRNVYHLTRSFYAKDKAREDAEIKRLNSFKKEREERAKQSREQER